MTDAETVDAMRRALERSTTELEKLRAERDDARQGAHAFVDAWNRNTSPPAWACARARQWDARGKEKDKGRRDKEMADKARYDGRQPEPPYPTVVDECERLRSERDAAIKRVKELEEELSHAEGEGRR